MFPLGLHSSLAGKRYVSLLQSIFRVNFAQHGIFKPQMNLCMSHWFGGGSGWKISTVGHKVRNGGIKKGAVPESSIFSNILGNPVTPNNHSALWATNKYWSVSNPMCPECLLYQDKTEKNKEKAGGKKKGTWSQVLKALHRCSSVSQKPATLKRSQVKSRLLDSFRRGRVFRR